MYLILKLNCFIVLQKTHITLILFYLVFKENMLESLSMLFELKESAKYFNIQFMTTVKILSNKSERTNGINRNLFTYFY